jgi:hypothetical protein
VSRKQVALTVTVEEKDGVTPDGVVPELPFGAEVASVIRDEMADSTKRNMQLGWRVTEVSNG